jgi:hypothetical protein
MMGPIWKARNISLKTKDRLFSSNVKPFSYMELKPGKLLNVSYTTSDGMRRFTTKSSG